MRRARLRLPTMRSWYLASEDVLVSESADWIATWRGSRNCCLSRAVLYHALFPGHARPPSSPHTVRTARSRTPGPALVALVAMVATLGGCGGSGQPTPPPSPSPSGPTLGGTVEGQYVLQIIPAESCSMSRAPITFDMTAAQ